MSTRARSIVVCFGGIVLATGCPDAGPGPAPAPAEPARARAAAAGPAVEPSAPFDAAAPSLGRVRDDAPLPLTEILGADPAKAESYLGPAQGKGGMRKTCVRFVPERTFFSCAHAWQRYADKTGTFETIEVLYEDGKAASIVFERVPGEGEFSPAQAVANVGIDLPGSPSSETPAEGVTRWSWFNSEARLLIHEHQYRVEVSNIGGDWAKTRVDVILNDPLTPEQQAKVVQTDASP